MVACSFCGVVVAAPQVSGRLGSLAVCGVHEVVSCVLGWLQPQHVAGTMPGPFHAMHTPVLVPPGSVGIVHSHACLYLCCV